MRLLLVREQKNLPGVIIDMSKETKILKIDAKNIDMKKINYCAEVIRSGGLVCFPTETVYGLGANAYNAKAVDSIFVAKGRPADNPLIVHISDNDMLELVTDSDGEQRENLDKLAKEFWPGPLTLIVHRDDAIPSNVSCGLDTVGVRFPSHPIAQALIKASGVPIAAPSANLSGKPSPTRAAHVIEDMTGRVDVIIDGGNCEVGVESTVFDISGEKNTILRPGAVTLNQISSIIQFADELDWRKPYDKNGEAPRSPGLKYRHYAPKAKVVIYEGEYGSIFNNIIKNIKLELEKGLKCGVLCSNENLPSYKEELEKISSPECHQAIALSLGGLCNPLEQASNLFATLRAFDELNVDIIFAEAFPTGGAGDAVMNRLYRSAGGNILH